MRYLALTWDSHVLELSLPGSAPSADAETDAVRLTATGATIGDTSTFERIDLAHGRVAFRTYDGRYLSCRPDDGANFGIYTAADLGPREVFEEILWPDQRVSLRSCELTYVSVAEGAEGRVVVNRTEPGPRERLAYLAVRSAVPEQATPAEVASPFPSVNPPVSPAR